MSRNESVRVLLVCLGNICRSPTAHGVLEHRLQAAGLHWVTVDSAGTAAYHQGKGPDARATAAAARRGVALAHLRARQVVAADFNTFDLILAMDAQNLADLREMAPLDARASVRLFLDFAQDLAVDEVPDPYYGGAYGFEQVLDLVEAAADGLVERLRSGDWR
ncbi:low molecular weight protein-tyrosine-phosphatase [Marinobacterium rhizophilum]|uniref:protein-tyrosine-phosphatase n=1 Tax=Marinobacterium rhizophilum TaxID=420402 RepID=A0ABY5HQQ0_9GAMM|nr:low molecular weight protein-tyrosine-phosphatase [Marinobacterium rhizophilum]UTW13547.1 low molecular weight phosphotyrosine protein phosphatase [Marinobacterium rhizophilum]